MDMSIVPFQIRQFGQQVFNLEGALMATGEAKTELPATHYFTENGMYCRVLFIPKGTVATGKVHKHPHFFMVVEGDLSVKGNDGKLERLTPPFITSSPAGTQRIVYAHADTLALTIHKSESQDLEVLEKELVTRTYQEYLSFVETKELEGSK